MELLLDADQRRLRLVLRRWLQNHPQGDEDGDLPGRARAFVHALGGAGFLAYVVPKKFGGIRPAIQVRDLCVIRQELAAVSSLADTMFAIQALASYPVAMAGTAKIKSMFLRRMASGEVIGAFALTEPGAGSDVASLRTRARKRGNVYVIQGTKSFISNAGLADWYVVFASTHPARRRAGVSAFLVRAGTPGLSVREQQTLMSPHPIGTITFDDCRVPETHRLGRAGDGLGIALDTLNALRCSVGAAAIGMAQRSLDEALRYSRKRRQFGRPLSQFQAIQFKLADMSTELTAASLLVYRAALTHDRNGPNLTLDAAMAKLFATETANRIVDQALQIHGGRGLIVGTPIERLFRDIRALRIYEGTSEIQRNIIARELLKRS